MEACNGRATLPSYTPVGIFKMGNYIDVLQGGTAGVFLGCLGDAGFKVRENSLQIHFHCLLLLQRLCLSLKRNSSMNTFLTCVLLSFEIHVF